VVSVIGKPETALL